MSKLLKRHAMGSPENKNQQGRKFDGICRVCVSIWTESEKLKHYLWERWRQAEKARLIIDNKNQDPFQFVSVW